MSKLHFANRLFAAASLLALSAPGLAADPAAVSAPPADAAAADPYCLAVRADRRALDPVLAVQQEPGDNPRDLRFASYSNYRALIERAEIRLFDKDGNPDRDEPFAIVPVDANGRAAWSVPAGSAPNAVIGFVLRAYGKGGVWDETGLRPLQKLDPVVSDKSAAVGAAAFGKADAAVHRTIPIAGVTLTVQGRADPHDQHVVVNGIGVPVSKDGLFVSEQIVPDASGIAHIEIGGEGQPQLIADRHYDASQNRWFVVGQGDITFSHAIANGPAVAVSGDPLAQGDHVSSRGAFYAKGVLGRDYRVTASLDTGETLLKDLVSNLDRKDPSQLLRRVDERYQYPTFGDSSTITADAPSQGQFYLRVQKDDSNLVIGNFITSAQGTELVQLDRGLFGAILDYKSQGLTRYGDRKQQLLAFASNPGTITASDELRGTGGSLYYLHHQDLSVGSERLRLEVRSPQTGAVLSSTALRVTEDYEIDYFQGRVTLLRPLSSYVPNDELVRAGAAAGNLPVLVARYEYSPPEGSIAGHSIGGRASQWIGDWLRLGVTGQSETAAPADQLVLGGDVTLKAGANSWLKGEYGRTDGPGFAQSSSLNGGLDFADAGNAARIGQVANAWRVEGALDERDLRSSLRGQASSYYEDYEAGYAAMGRISPNAMRRWGAKLDQQLGADTRVLLAYEGRSDAAAGGTDLARGEWTQQISPAWSIKTGLRFEDTRLPAGTALAQGQRLDGGIQATYAAIGAPWSAYVFGQGTLAHDAQRHVNNRGGVGFKWDLSRSYAAQAEVSDGTGGWAADAAISRHGANGSESRIGYRLYSDLADRGYNPQDMMTQTSRGMLVFGNQQRLGDSLTLTAEEKYGHGGTAPSLAHAYGLRFSPSKAWSFGAGVEKSTIFERQPNDTGGIDRLAAMLSAGYSATGFSASSAVEYRRDRQGGGEQTSWLFRNRVDAKPDDAWQLLGRFEYAFTDVAGKSLNAADYTRAVAGVAYRPVAHDRLNVLGRYTYMRDLGPEGQIMTTGGVEQPKQVSQVISLDVSYDLADWLSLGGKYACRQGRVSITRASDTFVNSAASLYVLRADFHVLPHWDALVEGRLLTTSISHDDRKGVLLALYRELGSGMKLGAGYNFTDYSADLTDQSYSTKGFFVNLLAAF